MGRRSYGEPILRGDISNVYIGNFCSIAQNVIMDCGWHHNTNFISTYPFNKMYEEAKHITSHPKSKGDIHIGSDVWIGEGAVIMSGVIIHSGSVIGARSVVTRDVSPYSIVAGAPALQIRKRFSRQIIHKLLMIRWWDWEEEKIKENIDLLMKANIHDFIRKHEKDDF